MFLLFTAIGGWRVSFLENGSRGTYAKGSLAASSEEDSLGVAGAWSLESELPIVFDAEYLK